MVMVVASVPDRFPMANTGWNTAGRPAGGGVSTGGTICGVAARELRAMLSDPIRITPALKAGLLRSMVNPVDVNVVNGVVVPALVQSTCSRAGTDNSGLMAKASKSGGALPNGAVTPSIHSGLPATEPAGSAKAPVLTT